MYMHSITRDGYNKSETLITSTCAPRLQEKWADPSPKRKGSLVFSQPVVANGIVYWGSFKGYEHATSVATGQDVWTSPPVPR
jgi:outer membrane protein assembly factor BamB